MMKYFVLAVALVGCVSAFSFDRHEEFEEDKMDARLAFSSNSSLASLIPDYRAVVAFIAIGLVLFAFVMRSSAATDVYDKSYYGQDYGQDYYHQDPYTSQATFNSRYGISNLATKMAQLETAFKKFEVETEECQMFVACEAAQLRKVRRNVPVVQIVSNILRTPGDESKMNPTVLNAFRAGQAEHENNNPNACVALRERCYLAHNNQ